MGDEQLKSQQSGTTFSYTCASSGSSLVKTHKISLIRKRWGRLQRVLLVLPCFCLGFLLVESGGAEFLWPLVLLGCTLFLWARRNRVVEEVIVVMPTLGVQLETVYSSKRVHRRFVPLEKIVAPVINEAVSPVTCYFYLALLLRGEDNLELTFLGLRPPLKMLVPIWRSLCEAVGTSVAKPLTSEETCNAPPQAALEAEL
ncbi:unnamed protein product [Calypogeia fissa]